MARRSASRVSWVLLIVVVAALSTGAAASILVASSSAPPPASGPSHLVILPFWAFEAACVAVLVFVLATMVLWGLQGYGQSNPVLNRMAVVLLVAVLLAVAFILAAHLLGFGGPASTGSTTSGNGTSSSGSGGSGGKNLTGPGGTIAPIPGLPGWVPFVALAVTALLLVVVAVPAVRGYLEERRQQGVHRAASSGTAPPDVRDALHRASAALDLGKDPRAVILALYAAILARLEPMVGAVDTSTPEEIRAGHLVRLGVRPAAARTLTRLFEEARYSPHPMGPAEGRRAREAVGDALDDLDRRNFVA